MPPAGGFLAEKRNFGAEVRREGAACGEGRGFAGDLKAARQNQEKALPGPSGCDTVFEALQKSGVFQTDIIRRFSYEFR